MSLKIIRKENNKTEYEFDNRILIWNIFKYLADTVYLKQFIVENYDGGNTLVPKEAWLEEGILYRELGNGVYFFPYDSIGFVVDDSIQNLTLYVVDHFVDGMDYKEKAELIFSIIDTDKAVLLIDSERESVLMALYLLSVMKMGFDASFLAQLAATLKGMLSGKIISIEYLKASFFLSGNGASFIVSTITDEGERTYYKFIYNNKKCRKEVLKEKEIINFGYLKKKIYESNKYIPLVIYALIAVTAAAILFFKSQYLILIIIILIVVRFVYYYIKKNAYKFFSR